VCGEGGVIHRLREQIKQGRGRSLGNCSRTIARALRTWFGGLKSVVVIIGAVVPTPGQCCLYICRKKRNVKLLHFLRHLILLG